MNNKSTFNKPKKGHSFPDPMAPDEVQKTEEYGLQWGNSIQGEWFHRKDGGGSAFHERQDQFHYLRTYARGDQDSDIYKKLMGKDGSDSYTNFDWRPIQVVPKFVKLIVNTMAERLFEVQANATDPFSSTMKDEYRKNLENLMVSKDMLLRARQKQGVNLLPDNVGDIPQSQEEVDLRMSLKFKLNQEIAAETAIRHVFEVNDFEETQSKVIEDIATIGIGCTKHYTDKSKGVMVDYVDPANMVFSYPDHRDFKNCYYYGEVERMTLSELRRIMRAEGKELTDDEYEELTGNVNSWASYHGQSTTRTEREGDMDGMMVDVLHFTFKTNSRTVYKKKYNRNGKGFKMSKKESTFDKPDDSYKGYDVVKKDREVWWEGSMILGTDHLFGYKKSENMVREKGQLNRTLPKYSMYAPEIYQGKPKSLVGRVIQYVDLMQQVHIKIQQMIAKARPSGVYIDVDGLSEIPLGDGSSLTPLEVIKIYDETGNVLGTNMNAEGSYNYGREPIRELKNGIVDGIDRLVNTYNFYLNQLRDAIGIPQGMDASMPHPDTLVGVQETVALNSNTATRHILDSILHITKRTAVGVNLRMKDIFKYSHLKDAYVNAIGKINVDILESLKNYHLHEFGIVISLKPDAEQKQNLERNIQIALEREQISLDDAIDIREVGNLKLANELLKIRRQRREKEKRESEENMVKLNAEENAKAAERASAAKQQEIQVETQSKAQLEQLKGSNALAKIEAEKQAKKELMELEFNYNMMLAGAQTELDDELDNRKTKRLKTFESSEDNISGNVEMAELEPS